MSKAQLTKIKPLKRLTTGRKNTSARNHHGRITVRHKGGGHKRKLRLVDFKQNRYDIPAVVKAIEYDPHRTTFIARIAYQDGRYSYVLAEKNMKPGDKIITSETAPLEPGNRTLLKNIPVGFSVFNVELTPGRGGQLGRSAGSALQILANEDGYTQLKMPSGEIRKVSWKSLATIGQAANDDHSLKIIGKAGRSRWLGIRPTVRGSAMNPVDHKYGGGEGRTQRGTKRPKDIWGNVTGGRKTRKKNKASNKFIIKRRIKKKRK